MTEFFKIKSKNIPLIYAITFFGGMMFFLPIFTLYLQENLLTAKNVALIFSIEAMTIALFEVPTGAISDLFGRKLTIVSALTLALIALIFLYIGGNFLMLIIYSVLSALAQSLYSGNDSAIIYDSLKEEGKENLYKKISGIYYALWPLGATIASLIGGYLSITSFRLPVTATIIPFVLALIFSFFIQEPKFEKATHKNMLFHMSESIKVIIKNRQLILLVSGGLILWAFGESTHALWQLYFKTKEIPLEYFGLITAFTFAASSLGFYLSYKVSEFFGNKKTLILSILLSGLLVLISTKFNGLFMVVLFLIPSFFFGMRSVILNHLFNAEIESSKRATLNSINNLCYRFGLALTVPFVGFLSDKYSINLAFALCGIIIALGAVFFVFLKDKNSASKPTIKSPF